jgi:hypothetical protein
VKVHAVDANQDAPTPTAATVSAPARRPAWQPAGTEWSSSRWRCGARRGSGTFRQSTSLDAAHAASFSAPRRAAQRRAAPREACTRMQSSRSLTEPSAAAILLVTRSSPCTTRKNRSPAGGHAASTGAAGGRGGRHAHRRTFVALVEHHRVGVQRLNVAEAREQGVLGQRDGGEERQLSSAATGEGQSLKTGRARAPGTCGTTRRCAIS